MQGWKIFTHSLGMIFNNLGAALKISLVLYLINSGVGIYFGSKYGDVLNGMQSGYLFLAPQGFWGAWFVTMLIGAITSLWIAVSWHRYILLEENPGTMLPPFNLDRILAYFGVSILIGLIIAFVVIIVGMIAGVILAGLAGLQDGPVLQLLLQIMVMGPVIYVFYRISLSLPAAALGKPVGIGESLTLTKPASGAIVQLMVIGLIAAGVLKMPSYFHPDPFSILNLVYTHVVGWFIMMGSVSILTTLYGVYVENREL